MTASKKIFALLLAALTVLCLLAVTSCGKQPAETTATTTPEETKAESGITVTIIVINDKAEEKTYTIKTTRKNLADVLLDEKLATGSEGAYGFVIESVEGLTADWNTDKAYWALYEGEEYAMTGASGIMLRDGGVYKLVYTK